MDRKEFATILSERRKELGYSYTDMIIKTTMDQSVLANILLNHRDCFMLNILTIMAALDLQLVAIRDIIGAKKSLTA